MKVEPSRHGQLFRVVRKPVSDNSTAIINSFLRGFAQWYWKGLRGKHSGFKSFCTVLGLWRSLASESFVYVMDKLDKLSLLGE